MVREHFVPLLFETLGRVPDRGVHLPHQVFHCVPIMTASTSLWPIRTNDQVRISHQTEVARTNALQPLFASIWVAEAELVTAIVGFRADIMNGSAGTQDRKINVLKRNDAFIAVCLRTKAVLHHSLLVEWLDRSFRLEDASQNVLPNLVVEFLDQASFSRQ